MLFPSIYQQTTGIWERDNVVLVKGKINAKDREGNIAREIKLLVDDARAITHEQAVAYQATGKKPKVIKASKASVKTSEPAVSKVYIRLVNSADQDKLLGLKKIIDAHPGETEVVLVIGEETKQIIRLPNRIAHESGLVELQSLIGFDHVKLQ